MKISRDNEKLADAVIFFVSNTKNCGITKLLKLLYFLDFQSFREAGRSVTGLTYRAWPKGPAPYDVWTEVNSGAKTFLADAINVEHRENEEKGRRFTVMKPLRAFDGRFFTRREKRLLEQIAEIYRDATTDQMVEITHLPNSPWDKTLKSTGPDSPIDYMLALDNKTRGQLSKDEVLARIAEAKEARAMDS